MKIDIRPNKRVGSYGPLDSKIMIVGEAPGADEEKEGRPFVGAAGKVLRDMLAQVGQDPDQVFYTNICKYRPPKNEMRAFFDAAGQPNNLVIEGLGELKEEIETVAPNVIVACGNYPMKMLTRKGKWNAKEGGYGGISDWRGSILEAQNLVPGRKVIPTYHPAYILRDFPSKAIGKIDLARAVAQSLFPEIRRPEKTIILDPRGEERQKWRDWLLADRTKTLSFDIEFINNKLLCVGMTVHRDYAVVIHTLNKADIEFVRSILESGIGLCAQNGMFDCSILEWFYDFKIMDKLVYDTMFAAHAAYIELPKGLDFLTSIYTEQPFYKDMVRWKDVASGAQPISEVLEYNGIDTWTTHQIMEEQIAESVEDPRVIWTREHEVALLDPLWQISKLGVKIDTQRLETLKHTLQTEAATFQAGIRMLAGRDVNLKSGPQIAQLVYGDLGLPIGEKTPGGKPKTNDDAMQVAYEKAKDQRAKNIIKMIREGRERLDLISKFCDIELDDDGRMRCHYDPAKTGTGRLSSRKFYPTNRGSNLQNVPRDARVRSIFVPDTGMVFGYADLMSAESWVVSYLSGDPVMLKLHQTPGMDGHKYVAAFLYDKPMEEITKDERYIGKKVRHGCNYAMGWYRLMQTINAESQRTGVTITAAQAKVYVNKYRTLHNRLPMWWREIEQELYATRTLYTLLGRKRIFFDRVESSLPTAIAYKPQGTVGDTLNVGLIKCARNEELRDLGFQMLLQVHDAIGYQAPEANMARVSAIVRQELRVPLPIPKTDETFTIPVEIQHGYNWGEKSKDDTNPNGLVVWHGDQDAA